MSDELIAALITTIGSCVAACASGVFGVVGGLGAAWIARPKLVPAGPVRAQKASPAEAPAEVLTGRRAADTPDLAMQAPPMAKAQPKSSPLPVIGIVTALAVGALAIITWLQLSQQGVSLSQVFIAAMSTPLWIPAGVFVVAGIVAFVVRRR